MKLSWRSLRVWVQSLSFLFLLYLILQAAFPPGDQAPGGPLPSPVSFYRDHLLISQKEFILRMLPAFGVLLFVIALGNFFCGWFCPMGQPSTFLTGCCSGEETPEASGRPPAAQNPLRGFRLRPGRRFDGWQLNVFSSTRSALITRTLVIAFFPPAVYIYNQLLPLVQKFLPENPFILTSAPLPLFQINILIFPLLRGNSFPGGEFVDAFGAVTSALWEPSSLLPPASGSFGAP